MEELWLPESGRKGMMPTNFTPGKKKQKSIIGRTKKDKSHYAYTAGNRARELSWGWRKNMD
jgi:hypothetical protein